MSFPKGLFSFSSIQKRLFLRGWQCWKGDADWAGQGVRLRSWQAVQAVQSGIMSAGMCSPRAPAAASRSDGLQVAESSPRHSSGSTARAWLCLQRNKISSTQKSARFLHLVSHS